MAMGMGIGMCFVPHFLAHYFLAKQRSPKAMLEFIFQINMQQHLLLECKALVDWMKASVV